MRKLQRVAVVAAMLGTVGLVGAGTAVADGSGYDGRGSYSDRDDDDKHDDDKRYSSKDDGYGGYEDGHDKKPTVICHVDVKDNDEQEQTNTARLNAGLIPEIPEQLNSITNTITQSVTGNPNQGGTGTATVYCGNKTFTEVEDDE